jgi:NifU-like protein involved in Fe-S cluster formation
VVSEALRALAVAAPGAGRLARGRTGCAGHPVCGDELELDLELDGGRITNLAWRARGCPATMAVAAALHGALVGRTVAEAPASLGARLVELGGLGRHEQHAEKLAQRALAAALAGTPP